MKFFIVLALAVFGASAAPADDVDVAADVTAVINEILDNISDPLLDIHDEKLNLDLGFEQLNFTFTDVVLSGIKDLEITTMDYDKDSGRLDYELTLGDVKADIKFDLLLSGILDADNNPVIDVELTNLKLTGYAVVDTSSSPHHVDDFKLLVTLEGATVDLEGLLNDDDLSQKLTDLLNDQLPTIVNDVAEQLEPAVSPIVKAIINLIISLTS